MATKPRRISKFLIAVFLILSAIVYEIAHKHWEDIKAYAILVATKFKPVSIAVASPAAGACDVPTNKELFIFFSKPLDPASLTSNTISLESGSSTIPSSISYVAADQSAVIKPYSALQAGARYRIVVKGGHGANSIKDASGNALRKDSIWSFTTAQNKGVSGVSAGSGGPILLISSASNMFSRFPAEILRAEGWNAFKTLDIADVTANVLAKYDVVIVGDISLSTANVNLMTGWVNSGGTLISFHPDHKLADLLGIEPTGGRLSDKYLRVNTASGPGVGIVNQTIQFHGAADLYSVRRGTHVLATLYSDDTTATSYPAVTSRNVGLLGGQAIAFTYDLARSVVYTRQGNPEWIGEKRDAAIPPIRSDNLFFGKASFDPQPDWVNLDKVAIPQSDEQQRLLTNIIMEGNYDRKPLPRFWFLPKGKKAAVVMTGDDHGLGGTIARFNQYLALSSSNSAEAVANWEAIRGTSYIFPSTPITNAQIAFFQNQGFEIGLHLNPDCRVWTPAALVDLFNEQSVDFQNKFPVVRGFYTHRIHCLSWSDWASLPKTELTKGIRLDVSYYYWPDVWVKNRPGMFTGSGMPMRFADVDGSLIDVYQVPTQMTDESGQTYPFTIDALLKKATGKEGYYGVFCANMHTDYAPSKGSDAIISSARAFDIPVVSAKQMLEWLDARNNSTFTGLIWNNNQLGFTVVRDAKALNLKGMLPKSISAGKLNSISRNGSLVKTTTEVIKGIEYVFFDAINGDYVANYGAAIASSKYSR